MPKMNYRCLPTIHPKWHNWFRRKRNAEIARRNYRKKIQTRKKRSVRILRRFKRRRPLRKKKRREKGI